MDAVLTKFTIRENKTALILAAIALIAADTALSFIAAPPRQELFAETPHKIMTVDLGCKFTVPTNRPVVLQEGVKYMVGGCK